MSEPSEPGQSSQSGSDSGIATSQVLDIGRRTRSIPTAIRRALWLRDRACRFPGCANHRFLHGHHVRHWLHGGSTSLNNLVLLCPFHHQQVHEGGFSISLEPSGEVTVREPGGANIGRRHPTPAAIREDDDLVVWMTDWLRPGDRSIDAWTATSSWDGDSVDYGAAIDAMLE
jgi:HNH endonuclease